MKNKNAITLFAVVMLVYQGWRTVDYMGANLLDVDAATRFIIAAAFLVFSEIGLLVWLHIGLPGATTDAQETTATGLIWMDFLGSMVIGLADLAKHNTLYVVDLSTVDPLLFFAPWVMVVANVAGYLIYHMNDSEAKLEQEKRKLDHAKHELEIQARREAIQDLQDNREVIAGELSPFYYNDIYDDVTGRAARQFAKQMQAGNGGPNRQLPPTNRGRDIPVPADGAGEDGSANPTRRQLTLKKWRLPKLRLPRR